MRNPLFSSKRALENKKLNKPCKHIDKLATTIHFVLVELAFFLRMPFVLLRHSMLGGPCTRFVLVGISLDQVA